MEPKRIPLTALRALAFGALVWCLAHSASAAAAEINCRSCHGKLGKEKFQHAALGMGCLTCHSAIDASAMPHKKTNTIARGLTAEQPDLCYGCHDAAMFGKKTVHAAVGMGCTGCHNPHSSKQDKLLIAEQPDLCYGCHDKAMFSKKTVHAAVGMGCTGCHNPHSTDGPKLLKSDPPGLCFTCHDKAEFSRKNVHVPVAGGMCMTCHTPHSSDTMALLTKEPVVLCLECHAAVEQKPHVIKGITGAGHPLGKGNKMDPKRPDKKFYCGSCHDPHSSDSGKLYRYPAKTKMALCINCHKF
jgi:DmsE family decaheme c-type cytochrome